MYAAGEYDLAGFAVGVVARKKIIDGSRVAAGDVALGIASSGLHSNGYSLARKALFESAGMSPSDRPSELGGQTVGEALLAPTRLYARAVRTLLDHGVDVHAMSHVTGGGLPGNVPRVLPDGTGLRLEGAWDRTPIFDLVQRAGQIDAGEMRRTFNLGVGYVVVVAPGDAPRALEALAGAGERAFLLGTVVRVPSDRAFEERVEWPA
jgi:phosphoribosylformylglycinamidine cyclo-ligase